MPTIGCGPYIIHRVTAMWPIGLLTHAESNISYHLLQLEKSQRAD